MTVPISRHRDVQAVKILLTVSFQELKIDFSGIASLREVTPTVLVDQIKLPGK